MEVLPTYVAIVFILAVIACLLIFIRATGQSKTVFSVLILWMLLQTLLARGGFYLNTSTLPPRFLVMIGPALLMIVVLFSTARGRVFIDGLKVPELTFLHVVRIPVELCLYWLFVSKVVPQLMTFEGRNFDVMAGISALPVYYYGYVKKRISAKWLLAWNIAALGLVVNVVVNGVLSAPFPFQQFAFDQPNIAVLYFPFNLLPAVVVPLVVFSHLVCIRRLAKALKKD